VKAFDKLKVAKHNLQRGVFTLQNKVKKKIGMEISPEKSHMMSFLGEDPVRSETIVGLQEVKNFKYLGLKFPMKMEKIFNKK